MSPGDIWPCWRCGRCCRLFVSSGPRLGAGEYGVIREELLERGDQESLVEHGSVDLSLPAIGASPPRRCVFLEGAATCLIYEKRPRICREYPIIAVETDESVVFRLSTDCPRGTGLAEALEGCLRTPAGDVVGQKQSRVVVSSFFDQSMGSYLGEET